MQIQIENFADIIERLNMLKDRKNMSTLEVIKRIRLRTGFFKIYESVDRLDMLELENKVLRKNIKEVKQDAVVHKNLVDQYKQTNSQMAKRMEELERKDEMRESLMKKMMEEMQLKQDKMQTYFENKFEKFQSEQ